MSGKGEDIMKFKKICILMLFVVAIVSAHVSAQAAITVDPLTHDGARITVSGSVTGAVGQSLTMLV